MADPPMHHATTKPLSCRFVDLPTDVYEEIFKFLDIRSVSRMFKAYSILPGFDDFRRETTKYFRAKVVNVSLEHIIQSNTTEISFDLLAYLPPCEIFVDCSVGLLELARVYLEQVEYKSLSLTVCGELYSHFSIDLNGLIGNVVALELIGVKFDANSIPVTIESLVVKDCSLGATPSLKHLVNLTSFSDEYCEYNYTNKLPPSLVSFASRQHQGVTPTDVSSLPNLKKVSGNAIFNIPWSQIETATVPHIPNDARCALLKEASIRYDVGREYTRPVFKNIYCPNLQKVSLHPSIEGEVTDLFTFSQLAQLKAFHGARILVRDLTLLPQAEDLCVLYDGPLTRHSVLPSRLVKLVIQPSEPVNGIPPQLEYLGLDIDMEDSFTEVNSATLKKLVVRSSGSVSIDCQNLIDLTLNVSSLEDCNVPNVERLKLESSSFPFERVPRLRRLTSEDMHLSNVSIDSHLEYVYLKNVQSSNFLISANIICVRQNLAFVQSSSATEFSDDYKCQAMVCNSNIKMPKLMESLTIVPTSSWDGVHLERCDDLKSICIWKADFSSLTVPKNVEKLRLLYADDSAMIHFVDTAKLEYIEYNNRALIPQYEAIEDVTPPAFIPDGFVQVGPELWCRPDILQLWKPS